MSEEAETVISPDSPVNLTPGAAVHRTGRQRGPEHRLIVRSRGQFQPRTDAGLRPYGHAGQIIGPARPGRRSIDDEHVWARTTQFVHGSVGHHVSPADDAHPAHSRWTRSSWWLENTTGTP